MEDIRKQIQKKKTNQLNTIQIKDKGMTLQYDAIAIATVYSKSWINKEVGTAVIPSPPPPPLAYLFVSNHAYKL